MPPIRRSIVAGLLALLAGCDAADPRVQPLPSLRATSAEQRARIPVVTGAWQFAGLEVTDSSVLAGGDTTRNAGTFFFVAQRLDSLGGTYAIGRGRFPFTGEVRRDSTVALVVYGGGGEQRWVAGRLQRDTLWVELTSLPAAEGWPPGTRAGWVRGSGAPRGFVRLTAALQAAADSTRRARADSARADSIARGLIDPTAPVALPAPVAPPAVPSPRPGSPVAAPPAQTPPEQTTRPVAPQPTHAPRSAPPATTSPAPSAVPPSAPAPPVP